MAVLCRKRSQFELVEKALRDRGLPVEVVGLGGLLSRPEVLDLVATLQVVHDPGRGDALMRLLTGPRWRIGPRDLESLAEWARVLVARHRAAWSGAAASGDDDEPVSPDAVDERSIVDALDSLPPEDWLGRHGRGFSAAGHARLTRLAGLLAHLRSAATSTRSPTWRPRSPTPPTGPPSVRSWRGWRPPTSGSGGSTPGTTPRTPRSPPGTSSPAGARCRC
jgi:DNA helicase-2/ATP-dependent DNA helicase PcrA